MFWPDMGWFAVKCAPHLPIWAFSIPFIFVIPSYFHRQGRSSDNCFLAASRRFHGDSSEVSRGSSGVFGGSSEVCLEVCGFNSTLCYNFSDVDKNDQPRCLCWQYFRKITRHGFGSTHFVWC